MSGTVLNEVFTFSPLHLWIGLLFTKELKLLGTILNITQLISGKLMVPTQPEWTQSVLGVGPQKPWDMSFPSIVERGSLSGIQGLQGPKHLVGILKLCICSEKL